MIRLIVRLDDATMAAHVGGAVQTTYRTFDIDHPEIEVLLRSSGQKPDQFSYATLSGAEVVESTRHASLPQEEQPCK